MISRANQATLAVRRERHLAMSAAERVALAQRLGDEGRAAFMLTQGLDRRAAVGRIKAATGWDDAHRPVRWAVRIEPVRRVLDLRDAAALLATDRAHLVPAVESRLAVVGPDAAARWSQVLALPA